MKHGQHRSQLKSIIDNKLDEVLGTSALDDEIRARLSGSARDHLASHIETEINRSVAVSAHHVFETYIHEKRKSGHANVVEPIKRFDRFFRAQHLVLMVGCLLLIFTGMPIKFNYLPGVSLFFKVILDIDATRLLHRIAGVMLIGVALMHLIYIVVFRNGREMFVRMFPRIQDVKDLIETLAYFFGRRRRPPHVSVYSFREKFDYWAVYWGMVIMIGSGVVLWGYHAITMQMFPQVGIYLINIAQELHSDEALLAALAIFIWHFYGAHFNPHHFPCNTVFWTGSVDFDTYFLEHRKHLEELRASNQLTHRQVERMQELERIESVLDAFGQEEQRDADDPYNVQSPYGRRPSSRKRRGPRDRIQPSSP